MAEEVTMASSVCQCVFRRLYRVENLKEISPCDFSTKEVGQDIINSCPQKMAFHGGVFVS